MAKPEESGAAGAAGWSGPGFDTPDPEALADVVAVHPLLALGLAGRGPFGAIAAPRPVPLRGQRRQQYFDDPEDWSVVGAGTGPPPPWNPPASPVPAGLRRILSADMAMHLMVDTLDPIERQVLDVIGFHGFVDRSKLLVETVGLDPEALDGVVRRLTVIGVVDLHDGLAFLSAQVRNVGVSGPPRLLERSDTINSARFDLACRLLGVEGGTLKHDRVVAVADVLSDRRALLAAVGRTSRVAQELFAAICHSTLTTGAVDIDELGIGYMRGFGSTYIRPAHDPVHPFAELVERCLVGFDEYAQTAWVWAESVMALQGRLHDRWAAPTEPEAVACDDDGAASVRRLMSVVQQLLDHFSTETVEGKKGGDQRPPIKIMRTLAATMSVEDATVTLAFDLAVRLAVIRPVFNEVPRGRRSGGPTLIWATDVEGRDRWMARPLAERWLSIVLVWIAATSLSDAQMRVSAQRHALLARLRAAPVGSGYPLDILRRWLGERYPFHFGVHIEAETPVDPLDELLVELRTLGLVAGENVVGVTALGRAAAVDVEAVAAALGSTEHGFMVQADHTVIAPPGLDPQVASVLSSMAELENDAGAFVYRLSQQRISTAAQHRPVDDLVTFLHEHSTVPVPSVVERFVRDAGARARKLEVTAAASVLVSGDPLDLVEAIKVKTAKLTLVAPTVAVSSLAPARLRQVLAGKGVVTAGGAADAAVSVKAPTRSDGAPSFTPGSWAPDWVVVIPGLATPEIAVQPIGIGPDETAHVVAGGL